jgi:GNAT superfamily N-acetyltransferase
MSEISPTITFCMCDFTNHYHVQSLKDLIKHYMTDAMGGCKPLSLHQEDAMVLGLQKQSNCFVLFIEYNNSIVGVATCFLLFSTFKALPYINVHDIVIHTSMRGKHLGKLLMQKIIEIGHHYNCCKITLEVREDNIVAQRMYKQLGFGDTQPPMHFWTKLLD